MPKPSASVTTTQTTEVYLKPLLRRQLVQRLKTFQTNKTQLDALTKQQEALKKEIEVLFTRAGELATLQNGVKVEGFSVKYHAGEKTHRLDKVALCKEAGITMAQIDAATKESPKKAYTKILVPGDKEDE